MIKNLKNQEVMKINVYLRDGSKFIGKDITNQPMGEHDRIISFWDGNIIKIYPLDLVQRFEYTFDV